MRAYQWQLADATVTDLWAGALARVLPRVQFMVALSGDLGAGKTHSVRALLRALGEGGTVRSPTYTLLEHYQPDGRDILHLDLYRLADAQELEHLGLRDFLARPVQLFVEWPQRGAGLLPEADLQLALSLTESGGRLARVQACTPRGRDCLEAWVKEMP